MHNDVTTPVGEDVRLVALEGGRLQFLDGVVTPSFSVLVDEFISNNYDPSAVRRVFWPTSAPSFESLWIEMTERFYRFLDRESFLALRELGSVLSSPKNSDYIVEK
jgi:hypothetical protein